MRHGENDGQIERRQFDFAAYAQEFLRRNPDYVREHRTLLRRRAGARDEEREVMARRWGLCFPCAAGGIA